MPGPWPGLVPQLGTHAPRARPRLLARQTISAHRNILRRDRGLAAWPEPRRACWAEGQLPEGSPLLSDTPAPDRIAWSFSPNPATGDRSTLTLRVGGQVPPGEYTLVLRGRAGGISSQEAQLRLKVISGEPGEPPAPLAWRWLSADFRKVAYGGGRWLAMARDCTILTSTDGLSWQPLKPEPGSHCVSYYSDAAYGDGRWVMVDQGGEILTSTDGLNWQSVLSSVGDRDYLYSLAYGDRRWMAVGSSGSIVTSTDGLNWRRVASLGRLTLRAIAYDGMGRWAAVGDEDNYTAAGVGPSRGQNPLPGQHEGDYMSFSGAILTSTDGQTWRRVDLPGGDIYDLTDVAYGGGRWVVVKWTVGWWSAALLTSLDGENWSRVHLPYDRLHLNAVAYGDGRWVAAGSGVLVTSP